MQLRLTKVSKSRCWTRRAQALERRHLMETPACSPTTQHRPLDPALPIRHDGGRWPLRGPCVHWHVGPYSRQRSGWLGCFLSNCRPSEVAATQQALAALLRSAESGWQVPFASLTAEERTRAFGDGGPTKLGACLLFESLDAAKADLARREAPGVRGATLNAAGLLELEPAFERAAAEGRVLTGNYFPDAWHLASPGALVTALAAAVTRAP